MCVDSDVSPTDAGYHQSQTNSKGRTGNDLASDLQSQPPKALPQVLFFLSSSQGCGKPVCSGLRVNILEARVTVGFIVLLMLGQVFRVQEDTGSQS